MTESITRLHISPLTPDLLPAVLGAALSQKAQNISYHSLQTFPGQPYGYLELPTMDAEKVKKKLNGAILKGKKIKVEEARPKKRRHNDTIEHESPATEEVAPRRSKRSKKDGDVVSAHEISPDRKVKRGWTEAKKTEKTKKVKKDEGKPDTKLQAPSKYTEKDELLFKTKIPPNKKSTKTKDSKKEKKDKSGADVVHEFKHTTTVPSFLRDSNTSDAKPAVQYEDDKGWVDHDGEIVEAESAKATRRRKAAKLGLEIDVDKAQLLNNKRRGKQPISPPPKEQTSSEMISSSEECSDEEHDEATVSKTAVTDADETSSSGTSSPSDSDSESESESEGEQNETAARLSKTADIPTGTPPAQEVHPLEALFKKPSVPSSNQSQSSKPTSKEPETIKPTLELNTTFSFFEQGASDSENEIEVTSTLPTMPMTPFSSQDFRSRTMRSAAPTPDTADPRKSKGYASFMLGHDSADSDDEESSESEAEDGGQDVNSRDPTPTQSQSQLQSGSNLQPPQSDFEKRFWETRGENNRAWKTRRRAVLKEKRQRENRARRPKTW